MQRPIVDLWPHLSHLIILIAVAELLQNRREWFAALAGCWECVVCFPSGEKILADERGPHETPLIFVRTQIAALKCDKRGKRHAKNHNRDCDLDHCKAGRTTFSA